MKKENQTNRRQIGGQYEKLAGAYLAGLGYQVLQYNYRCRQGEIDLIARDHEYLVFCEIKYRTGKRSGDPAEAVNRKKQERISRSAMVYLTQHDLTDVPCRFDVISITGEEIRHIPNAFNFIGA